jgi:myosin heavy subunit
MSELGGKLGNRGGTGGFNSNLNNSAAAGRGRVVSARMNRQPSGNVGGGAASHFDGVEFYYMTTSDAQVGPANIHELKSKFQSGEFAADCFYWYEGMGGWEALESNPSLLQEVCPPAPPTGGGGGGGGGAPPPPPARSQPAPPSRPKSSTFSAPKEQQAHAPRRKVLEKGWIEKLTADLVPYYYNSATGVLQWEKPEELLGGSAKATGNTGWVWVPDEENGYSAGRSLGGNNYQTQDGRSITYAAKRGVTLDPLNPASLNLLHDDLVLLEDLCEGMVLHNLKERYLKDQIYCGVGAILIAINPFKRLPLYTPDIIEKYNKRGNKVLPPHPFDIADKAYKTLLEVETNQSILVSGESGAGKTETTKQCLMFLADVAGSKANIEQRVLSVNPILEAFGNAKTLRNDNSSRFGRFSEIILDNERRIAGAQIQSYLLEKSRVGYQQQGERNYHIFYQLCKSDWAGHYQLGGPEYYGYLANSNSIDVKGIDDFREFQDVVQSMDSLGFTEDEKHSIFSIISGIIQLGNVTFSPANIRGADGSTIDDINAAYAVASQFGVDSTLLHDALTHRTLEIIGQAPVKVPLRVEQALENRDALAKYVYEKVFHWIVARINKSLAPEQQSSFIGILDIFGFEIFVENSFEQLCINFCNEKLQQLFNQDTFKNEEEVYKSEGVDFPPIVFIDNQPVVDLIEMRGGIFTLLDDVVKGPGKPEQKDQKFSTLLDSKFSSNPCFVPSNQHRGIRYTAFSVNHYAGQVPYNVDRFVDKNKDSLFSDLYDMMAGSTDVFIQQQFSAAQGGKVTLAGTFKKQLDKLMKDLKATQSHYIRCIKANSQKKPRIFEGASCLEQLKCAGVFEAVTIRKNGYPFRYTFQRFVERYKCILATEQGWRPLQSSQLQDQCYEILSATGQAFAGMQWGRTMVLFRADEYRILELCRALSTDRVSSKIQAKARGRLTRRYLGLIAQCRPTLWDAVQSRDLAQLESALQYVNQCLGQFAQFSISAPIAEWAQAKELIVVIRESARLEPELEQWVYSDLSDDNNFEMLFKTIKSAREIANKHPTAKFDELYNMSVEQFSGWRDYRLTAKLEEVMKELERDAMGEIYAECKRLEYESPALDEIEKLMGVSEEELLKMQYKKANENGDAQRAVEKEIELKELVLEQFAANFEFAKCGMLRDADDYAAAKLFSMHREEHAAGFLLHTNVCIFTSLTRIEDPLVVKEALNCFKCIMGYSGDNRATYPDSFAVKVIQCGIDGDDWLRAEIYAQIMKQLSSNPDTYNRNKYWELFMLCLLHFAPGDGMENFVQIFIRDNAESKVKDAMIRQAHVIGYEDSAYSSPPVNMLSSLLTKHGF